MRATSTVVLLFGLVVAAVLVLGALGLRYERTRLLEDFAVAQQETARQLTSDLARELDNIDDDARLVASLVDRAEDRTFISAEDQDRFIRSAFEALATAVRHYHAIFLFHDGTPRLSAIDPGEAGSSVDEFERWSESATREAELSGGPVFDGPRAFRDGRRFFAYARPTSLGDTLVLMSDARYLTQPVLRSRARYVEYLLVDPAGSIWLGCAQAATCRAVGSDEWAKEPGIATIAERIGGAAGYGWDADQVPATVGLPQRPAAFAWQPFERNGRRWVMAVVASAETIHARERWLLGWFIGTSAALAFLLTAIGTVIVRHQRRTVAMHERLIHAQEVAQLREKTEKLLDNVSVGLVGVTDEGRVVLTNRFLAERVKPVPLGASVAEALSEGDVETAARLEEALYESLKTGRSRAISGQEVRLFGSKAGHFDLRIIPLEQPADDVAALLLVEDLSELKNLEKQLVRAEKLITVGVLGAGLAHEIGTPLGIIRGRAELLLSKIHDPAVARDLESVIRQIDQIGSTIRQVLDFARAQPVELTAVDARGAAEAAVAMLDLRMRQKSVAVHVEGPDALPAIAADPDQLQQVLVNLLLNACDACEKGGAIAIALGFAERSGALSIEIKDDGCGISDEDLNAVFDPYFTTKKRGGGTGLGLPVAASIVRNHQGEISLKSKKGRGTTVRITWPVAKRVERVRHA